MNGRAEPPSCRVNKSMITRATHDADVVTLHVNTQFCGA